MKKTMVFIATGAYVGRMPLMPGTFGTLWGVFFAWLAGGLSIESQALITLVVIAASVAVSGQASRALGGKDHPSIIVDEISGYLVGIFLIPFTPFNAILVFILFRFFDILKPYPAGLLDRRLGGGAGIVLDDLVAGVYANISAHAVLWLI